jgi:hypothetical protein
MLWSYEPENYIWVGWMGDSRIDVYTDNVESYTCAERERERERECS